MLFNSDAFLFEFLPIALVGFFFVKRYVGPRGGQIWLVLASFVFYASAGWQYLPPLVFSIFLNFFFGRALARRAAARRTTRALLAAGIVCDLALLGWFKYADFVLAGLGVAGVNTHPLGIVLPLGISFYTFTQIAFLVDAARGEAEEYDLPRYALFVTFFPHLIAGPIIHHREMMPQLEPKRLAEPKIHLLPEALMLFAIGLTKKVLLADNFATLARPVFNAAAAHSSPDLISAWGATLAYTFQIYFDFAGYSDMALGLALMFGVRLPMNFFSPYKSTSIIEFWRRWHMTLSRFLRDYLYFPLGGNRKGPARRYANIMIVMAIGGLWHGAGWTFVLWGALHGFYLLVNHAWRGLRRRANPHLRSPWPGRVLTFLAVSLGWVLFRADSFDAARSIYAGLFGLHGAALSADLLGLFGIHHAFGILGWTVTPLIDGQDAQWRFVIFCALGMILVWALPNSMVLTGFAKPEAGSVAPRLGFRLLPRFAIATGILLFLCTSIINSGAVSEFIYYRF